MATDAELKAIFTAFDTSGDGFISMDELEAALIKGGKKVTKADVKKIVDLVDKNNDNQVDFEEFKEVFKLAPDAMPRELKMLVDTSGLMLNSIKSVGSAFVETPTAVLGMVSSPMGSLINMFGGKKQESTMDISDTNMAGVGSDEDKAVRKAAAKTEKAWAGVGKEVGIQIWRVEKFKVVPWPKDKYGSFYEGDSYIVLHTYKEAPDTPKLVYDLYFWLGKKTTQDEMGTAAYKSQCAAFLTHEPNLMRQAQRRLQ